MIKIIYACNDKLFDGLYLSILSVIRRSKSSFNFYVLTGDFSNIKDGFKPISEKHIRVLNDLVKKYNQESFVQSIDCTPTYNKYLKGHKSENNKYSPYATLRLLIDKLPQLSGKILYLDCDTMANKDVKEIYDFDIQGYDFGINLDWISNKYLKLFAKNYINTGVILFDVDQIRKSDLLTKVRAYLYEKKLWMPDQTALYRIAKNYKLFPGYTFNRQSRKIDDSVIVKHFCARIIGWPFKHNIKQWNIKDVHKILKIHNFDEDFNIYLEDKKNW